MPKPSSIRRCAMCTAAIFCLMLLVSAFDAHAGEKRWRSNRDKLPGLSSPTPILVAAGILVAVMLLARAGKDKQKEEDKREEKKNEEDQDKAAVSDSSGFASLNSWYSTHAVPQSQQGRSLQAHDGAPFSLYLTVSDNCSNDLGIGRVNPAIPNKTFGLGVALNF